MIRSWLREELQMKIFFNEGQEAFLKAEILLMKLEALSRM
jgi:hypothetical protein